MEAFDYKEAVKIMETRGYTHTADNHSKNVLFFLKTFDSKKLHLHATITLATHLIDLDTVGNLDLGVTLYCDSIDIKNPKFEEFEKKLLNYLYLCLHGNKPVYTMEGNSNDELPSKSKTDGGQLPVGGVKTGQGKPEKEKPTAAIEDRKKKFWEEVKGVAKQKGYPKELAIEFYKYWSEVNKSNTRFRRENETFFDIPKRFATWIKNDKKWAKETFVEAKITKQEQELTTKKPTLKHKDLF